MGTTMGTVTGNTAVVHFITDIVTGLWKIVKPFKNE